MGDFPNESTLPLIINNYTGYSVGPLGRCYGNGLSTIGSFNWPSANLAIYVPFSVPWYYPVRRMFWCNGTTAGGNASIGLYTAEGANLYASASTVTVGTSVPQYVTPATDLWLSPGAYFVGVSFSGTTNVCFGSSTVTAIMGRHWGLRQQATAVPVPSPTATFAAFNSTGMPVCGFTRLAAGF